MMENKIRKHEVKMPPFGFFCLGKLMSVLLLVTRLGLMPCTLKKKFDGRYVYSLHLPSELKPRLQGQVFHCCVQGSTLTPHPFWEHHVTSLTRLPGRTQVQIKWNEFRPRQLQDLFIRDWGKYWNQQDD